MSVFFRHFGSVGKTYYYLCPLVLVAIEEYGGIGRQLEGHCQSAMIESNARWPAKALAFGADRVEIQLLPCLPV